MVEKVKVQRGFTDVRPIVGKFNNKPVSNIRRTESFVANVPSNLPSPSNGASPAFDMAAYMAGWESGNKPSNMRESFIPWNGDENDAALGPYSVISTQDVRYPAVAVVQKSGKITGIHTVSGDTRKFQDDVITTEAGVLFPYVEFKISDTEKYTVTGIFVNNKDAIEHFQNSKVVASQYIESELHYAIIFGLLEKWTEPASLQRAIGKITDKISSNNEKLTYFFALQKDIIQVVWALGETRFVTEVREAALNINKITLDNISNLAELGRTVYEAARKERRPSVGPQGTITRIANRMRRIDLYEAEENVSRLWESRMKEVRLFHVLPEQRYDLGYASEILHGQEPYDFKRLMFPFEEFGIKCDGDWVDTAHVHNETCDHPKDAVESEISLFKPCGHLVRGSRETGIWHMYEKYIARNDECDLNLYTSCILNEKEGTLLIAHNSNYGAGMPSLDTNRSRIESISAQTIKFVVNFVLVLNHRGTKVTEIETGKEPGRPATRQQRRAEGYKDVMENGEKRDHYKIYVPALSTLYKSINEVTRGVNVKERRPHDVRGHLRKDKYGRKRIKVTDHKRCRYSQKPYFLADYDSANLGME